MGGDHPEIAVTGLGRVNIDRRGAGRGHGRGDLAGHMPAFAHAADDDAAAAFDGQQVEARATSSDN